MPQLGILVRKHHMRCKRLKLRMPYVIHLRDICYNYIIHESLENEKKIFPHLITKYPYKQYETVSWGHSLISYIKGELVGRRETADKKFHAFDLIKV